MDAYIFPNTTNTSKMLWKTNGNCQHKILKLRLKKYLNTHPDINYFELLTIRLATLSVSTHT